ncbi:MAG TPA: PA0069 family radical SAM protein [Steroidobacteraceae bacterium]|nr:PA0069 family radical SAM protein [Steroidobacteraceae bacterium]
MRLLERKGRGAVSNRAGRFESLAVEPVDDGWGILDEPLPPLETQVLPEPAQSIITRNNSPDIPFDQSINPYRGCENGCVYCFARPSHAYVNLSPGLDFETKLFFKQDAALRLRQELNRRAYKPSPINLGANTDPYQPLEKKMGITRSILEVLAEAHHPVTIVTKSALVVRDLDLLGTLAAEQLVRVFVSLTTLDDDLKRRMEPRASGPAARLAAIRSLSSSGIPTGVMFAPVVPAINDHELEDVLAAAATAGTKTAGYLLLRLPGEVRDLFYEWLETHYPERANRVRNRIRELRGGRDNDPRFGHRMRGHGPWATLLRRRFEEACRRNGLESGRSSPLSTDLFRPPNRAPGQMALF